MALVSRWRISNGSRVSLAPEVEVAVLEAQLLTHVFGAGTAIDQEGGGLGLGQHRNRGAYHLDVAGRDRAVPLLVRTQPHLTRNLHYEFRSRAGRSRKGRGAPRLNDDLGQAAAVA